MLLSVWMRSSQPTPTRRLLRTKRGRELGADADDCVSSGAGASWFSRQTTASSHGGVVART
jgi:hypothetical protein